MNKYRMFVFTQDENESIPEYNLYNKILCNNLSDGIDKVLERTDIKDDDIIGLLSKGHYFVKYDLPLDECAMEEYFTKYDVLIPYDNELGTDTIKDFYVSSGNTYEDIINVRNSISERCSDYLDAFDIIFNSQRMFFPNNLIARKAVIREYISFCKKVIGDEEKYDVLRGWLLKVFLYHKQYKVRSVIDKKCDAQIWNSGEKKIEIIQNYIDIMLNDIVAYRREYGFDESFIPEMENPKSLGEKHPIWVCWWQGEDDMPEIIRVCYESLKKNIPDTAEIHFITLNNCMEYVTFNDVLIDKFNSNIISYTHMSDLLRVELLYRYGGMWIDLSYIVSHKIEDGLLKKEFTTMAFEYPLWRNDVMKGRWNSSLLIAQKKCPVITFVLEGLWTYWEQNSETLDYFIFDYILETGYKNFASIRALVDNSEITSNRMYDLQLKINQRATDNVCQMFHKESVFYKLNRRNEYIDSTEYGFPTLYKYIKNIYCEETRDVCDSNQTRVVSCRNAHEAMMYMKTYNPEKILDVGLNILMEGAVSKGLLEDIVTHEIIIDGVLPEEYSSKLPEISSSIYNSIFSIDTCDNSIKTCIASIEESEKETVLLLCPQNEFYDAIIVHSNEGEVIL